MLFCNRRKQISTGKRCIRGSSASDEKCSFFFSDYLGKILYLLTVGSNFGNYLPLFIDFLEHKMFIFSKICLANLPIQICYFNFSCLLAFTIKNFGFILIDFGYLVILKKYCLFGIR